MPLGTGATQAPPGDALCLCPQTVLRIWDCLFNEGSKILFRVALTLIKQHQAFILEAGSVADICERFKEITRGGFVTECHTFMQVSVGAPLLVHRPGRAGPGMLASPAACPWVPSGPRLSPCSVPVGPAQAPSAGFPCSQRLWSQIALGCPRGVACVCCVSCTAGQLPEARASVLGPRAGRAV